MHSTCSTNTLSTNKVLQALELCHLPVVESCVVPLRTSFDIFPQLRVKEEMTQIKQFFTYYLIQGHLILYD